MKLRPHPRKLPRTLRPRDIEMLIDAIDTSTLRGLRDRAMLEMAYGCGLRVSELVGLQLHQVNLAAGVVVVLRQGQQGADGADWRRGGARAEGVSERRDAEFGTG